MTTQEITAKPARQRPAAAGSTAPAESPSPFELVDSLGRVIRLFSRLKAEFAARHPGSEADFGAMSLLIALVDGGPRRAGALAESVLMDPSQVSRRVAALVRAGLVERRADFADGRAILLVATPAGRELCAEMIGERARYLREVVRDWPAGDIDAFVGYLDRFAAGVEQTATEPGGRSAGAGHPTSHGQSRLDGQPRFDPNTDWQREYR